MPKHAEVVQVAIGIVVAKASADHPAAAPRGASPPSHSHLPSSIDPHRLTRVLITQRKADQVLGGSWELPGGKLEPRESPEDAVIREIREEVGIDVAPIATLPPVEHRYDHAHVRLIPYVCTHLAGQPRPIEVAQVKWVRPDQLADYAFPEASVPVIDTLLRWLETAIDAIPAALTDRS
jgi:mutator protein MutT